MAHTITRWLGPDSPDHTPMVTTQDVTTPGWLLLCSDGLWNYASAAQELADVFTSVVEEVGTDVLPLSRALVDWANARGGRDNITVALARIDPAAHEAPDAQAGRIDTIAAAGAGGGEKGHAGDG